MNIRKLFQSHKTISFLTRIFEVIGIIVIVFFPTMLWAQEKLEETRNKGIQQLQSGSYDMARKTLEKIVQQDTQSFPPLMETYLCTGAYEDALSLANKYIETQKDSVNGYLWKGKVYLQLGRYAEAKASFLTVYSMESHSLAAQFYIGYCYFVTGDREKYQEYFGNIFDEYDPDNPYSAEDLWYIARASRLYAQNSDEVDLSDTLKTIVEDILPDAVLKDKYFYPAYQEMADIFLAAFNPPDAKLLIEEALKLNSQHPDMLWLQAKYFADDYGLRPKAIPCLEHCLKINPKHVAAMALAGAIYLSDEEYTKAQQYITRALDINPHDLTTLSIQAAMYYMQNRENAYEEQCRKILALNPTYGELYYTIATMIGHKRQFSVGVELNKQAIEKNPFLWPAYIELGMSFMRVGNIVEAEKQFKIVKENYNFHTQSHNMLILLQKYKEFKTYKTEHFTIRLHVSEADVIYPLLSESLEKGFQFLVDRYKFTPDTPILFEMFPSHKDFSVRTIGLDSLGASGACFGHSIVAVSPKSRTLGDFNWSSVAWHELTHVFTLQMSNFQVPRWFTEGLSEFAEWERNPSNQRKHDLHLFAVYTMGKLRGLSTFNAGFTRPEYDMEVSVCYYQAGLICQYISQNFGFDTLCQMLQLFRQGQTTQDVIKIVFKLTLEEFDQKFLAWIHTKVFDNVKIMPSIHEDVFEELKDIIEDEPTIENYIKLGLAYFQRRKLDDAEACAEKIMKMDSSMAIAYDIVGQIAYARGNVNEAIKNLEKAVSLGSQQFDTLQQLGVIYYNKKKIKQAIDWFDKAKKSYPTYVGPNNPYLLLAKIYKQTGQKAKYYTETENYLKLEGSDFKGRLDLAKEYAKDKNWERVQYLLQEALDVYPLEPQVHLLLIQAKKERKQFTSAITNYTILLALQPKEAPEYHVSIAELYLELGNKEKAKEHASTALQMKPELESAKEILKKV